MKRLFTELKHILVEYKKNDCFNLAAAISFYAIMSLLPVLLLLISLVGIYMGQSDVLLQKTVELMETISPALREGFVKNLETIVKQKLAFGWVSIVFLFAITHFLLSNLEKTMNRLLHSKQKRHFLFTRLLFLVFLMGIALLLLAPSMIGLVQTILEKWGLTVDFKIDLTGNIWFFISSWIVFILLILLIPSKRVEFKNAFLGGAIFAVLILIARWAFRLYTLNFIDRYNILYGSLTALILGALWIFYFSNILLLCVLWVGEQQRK